MRLTEDKIYNTIGEVVGEDSIRVIKYLKGKKNISDFEIAEKVDRDIHEIRNILYRLFNHNLVTYYRKKDREKGWYISYWTFNRHRVQDVLKSLYNSKLEKFKSRLSLEEANIGNFYLCPNACTRIGFEKAFDLEYRCPECGSILNHQDNSKTIEFLREKIEALQNNGLPASISFVYNGDGNGIKDSKSKSPGKIAKRKIHSGKAKSSRKAVGVKRKVSGKKRKK